MSDKQRATVNRILRCRQDCGDPQFAWEILGLQGNPVVPEIEEFLRVVNELLDDVNPENWISVPDGPLRTRLHNASCGRIGRGRRQQRNYRSGAILKIIEAIHTLADFQNEHWSLREDYHKYQLPIVDIGDRPPNAIPWANITPPLINYVEFLRHNQNHPVNNALVMRDQLDPTPNEIRHAIVLRARLWAENGYIVAPAYPVGNRGVTIVPGITWPQLLTSGDGNCHWYAMAEALSLSSPLMQGPDRSLILNTAEDDVLEPWLNRLTAPSLLWAEIKANLRFYFMSVITNPAHPRYKMYHVLQRLSARRSNTFGETSILRLLHHSNRYFSCAKWLPAPIPDNNRDRFGFYQIFADYYHVEVVILWEADGNIPAAPTQNYQTAIRGVCKPRRRQVFIFHDTERHSTASRPNPANIPGWRFPTDLAANRNLIPFEDRCDSMPWHPAVLTQADLPRDIAARWRYPAVRAPQREIDYVLADRDFPVPLPFLEPLDRQQRWRNGNSLSKDPVPGPGTGDCHTGPPPLSTIPELQ